MTRAAQIATVTVKTWTLFAALLLSADLAKGSDVDADRCEASGVSLVQTHSSIRNARRSETSDGDADMEGGAQKNLQREKSSSSRAVSLAVFSTTMVAKEAAMSAWLKENVELARKVREEPADFGDFIFDQKASSDACSARLLEAKRAKDTLSKEMLTLSSTIQGHMTVQVTETENLKISAATIKTLKVKNEELRNGCDEAALVADKEADGYLAELVELKQIANPEVRHQAARDACGCVPQAGWSNSLQTCKPEAKTSPEQATCCEAGLTPHDGDGGLTVCINKDGEEVAPATPTATGDGPPTFPPDMWTANQDGGSAAAALIQQAAATTALTAMTKEQCLAFVAFQAAHGHKLKLTGHHHGQKKPTTASADRACDEERTKLQAEFNKAYLEISSLEKKARARVTGGRKECLDDIDAQLAEALAPMLSSRETSTERCEAASQAIAQLQPILNSAGDRVKRLKEHLENLKTECVEAGDATEHLKTIRALIYSLEHCPGRNDFQLSVPEVAGDGF